MKNLLSLFLLLPVIAFSAPATVVAVLGESTSIEPYLSDIQIPPVEVKTVNPKQPVEFNYQTKSSDLTVGKVATQTVDIKNMNQPIFIVGTDKTSVEWLKTYQQRLKELQAVGVVVNVSDNRAYEDLVKEFGLHLLPLNADELAKQFGITHYPVLISKNLIEQ